MGGTQSFPETAARRFQPYPKYKTSCVGWLGEIPAHWTIIKLKYAAPLQGGYAFKSEDFTMAGIPIVRMNNLKRGFLDLSEAPRIEESKCLNVFSLKDGDLLIGMSGSLGETGSLGNYAIVRECDLPCQLNQRVGRFILSDVLLRDFLLFILAAKEFTEPIIAESVGTAQFNISPEKLGSIVIALAPRKEQRSIAEFLDRETANIDALIARKERLVELLQEKRTALITHAFTKGLDPNVPMKDSGVEWLGKIPAHWGTEQNRRLFRESDNRSDFGEEELLSVSHLTGVTRHSEKNVTMIEAESHEGYKICRAGELVTNTMWAWMGALGVAWEYGMVSPSYNVYVLTGGILNTRYYDYLCRVPVHVSELTKFSKGIWKSRLRLYPDEFYEISTPLPPLTEQERIVDFINREVSKIGALMKKVNEAIDHLKEYRTALISAAVTGKIEVQ